MFLTWIVAVLLVAAWRYQNLDVPPNWGASIAMCREADYLARTNFDYASLRYTEPPHYDGGARVYMTSYMPSLIAWGMWYFDSITDKLRWFHLLGMLAGGTLAALFYQAARVYAAPRMALLATLALITFPITVVQIDNAGMDLVMTVFLVATILALQQQRWLLSCLLALLTFGAKSTGLVYSLALALTLALLTLAALRLPVVRRPRLLYAATLLAFLLVPAEYALIQWGETMSVLYADLESEEIRGIRQVAHFSPHTALLILLPLTISVWQLRTQRPQGRPLPLWIARLLAQAVTHRVEIFLAACLLGMLLAGEIFELIPRYFVSLAALGLLLLVALLSHTRQIIPMSLFAACVLINVTDVESRWWRAPEEHAIRPGTYEASYGDLELSRQEGALVREIAALYPDLPVVASGLYELYFGLPNLGFVAEPRTGYAVKSQRVPGFENLTQLMLDRPQDAIFVAGLVAASTSVKIPPPTADDEIIHQEAAKNGTNVFRKNWSTSPPSSEEVFDWYRGWIFPFVTPGVRVAALATVGRWEDAKREALQAENPAQVLVDGAGVLLHHQRYSPAEQLSQLALEVDPHCADANYLLALAALNQDATDRVGPLLLTALEQQPGHPRAAQLLASLLLREGRKAECLSLLKSTLQDRADHLELWNLYQRLLLDSRDLPGIHQGVIDAELMRAEDVIPRLKAASER
jgi:tetratricopeptide (TPR) repeat protein